jgi:hypothetical protein
VLINNPAMLYNNGINGFHKIGPFIHYTYMADDENDLLNLIQNSK